MNRSGCSGLMMIRSSSRVFASSFYVNSRLINVNSSGIQYHHRPIRSYHASVGTNFENILNSNESNDRLEHSVAFYDVPVSDILSHKLRYKGSTALVVNENDSLATVAHKMAAEWDVGATLVRDDSGHYTGIFTERDFLRKVAEYPAGSPRDWREISVKEFMTKHFKAVTSNTSCVDCMKIMTKGKFRRLPIVDENDDNKVIGFVSLGDLVSTVISGYKQSLEFYSEYISGKYSAPAVVTNEERERIESKPPSRKQELESGAKASM